MCLHIHFLFTSNVSLPNDSKLWPLLNYSNLASNLRHVGWLLTFLCTNHKHTWTVLLRQLVPSIFNGLISFFYPGFSLVSGTCQLWEEKPMSERKKDVKSDFSAFRQSALTTPGCSLPPAKSPSEHTPSNTHSNPRPARGRQAEGSTFHFNTIWKAAHQVAQLGLTRGRGPPSLERQGIEPPALTWSPSGTYRVDLT